MAETIKIGGELESMATGKIVAAASAIKDKSRNKTQEAINGDVEAAIADISNQLEDKPIVKTEDNGYTIGEYAGAMATDAIGLGAGQAFGSYSLAEGYGSATFGQGSHAEGQSVASGAVAHAEGANTYSWAVAAHVEGYKTVSMWNYAHAEGSNVLASGLAAHAEGFGFVDNSKITPAKRFHLIVYNDRIEFKNDEGISIHDILKQPVLMLESDSGEATLVMPLEVIDYNSVTNVVRLRDESLYMEGDYALLQSYKSEEGTTITCAILKSGAQGNFSHVEGNNTRALDDGAHAEGIKTKAIGLGSHAEGNNSDERFEVIVADDTVMSDSSSQDTTVTLNSFTGSLPDSANFNNIALGIAIARISYFEYDTTYHIFLRVKGVGGDDGTRAPYIVFAYAEETSGCTIPAGSAIEIYYSGALGAASHVEGYNTAAAGEASHAEGYYTQTTNASEHAEGTYNLSTPNKTLSSLGIGSGSGQTPRMNAYEVDLQGNVYIKGIGGYDGTNITASGVESVQEVIARLEQALGGNNS